MSLFGKGHRNVCAGLDWNSWVSLMLCSRCLGSPTRYVDSDIWLISLHMETCCQMTGRKSRNATSKWVGVVWNRHSFHGLSFPTVSYRMMLASSLILTITHYNKNKCHRMVDGWSWLVTYYYGNRLLQDILVSSTSWSTTNQNQTNRLRTVWKTMVCKLLIFPPNSARTEPSCPPRWPWVFREVAMKCFYFLYLPLFCIQIMRAKTTTNWSACWRDLHAKIR